MKIERGFLLVGIIFLLVIMGIAIGFAVQLISNQSTVVNSSLFKTQTYYAALSGLEYASYMSLSQDNWCNGSKTLSTSDDSLFSKINIVINCTSSQHSQDTIFNVYHISSTAEYGNFGDPIYIKQTLTGILSDGKFD